MPTDTSPGETLRVAFVPGVMPDRWVRRWRERPTPVPLELLPIVLSDQLAVLDSRRAEMCFLRLPVSREDLHLVHLYDEEVCVVAGADHPVAAFSELGVADLAGEHLLLAPDSVTGWPTDHLTPVEDPDLTTARAVETAATGTGVVVLPRSVARLHQRKDVVCCRITDIAAAPVALAWLKPGAADEREAVRQDFVGVVRGRTARSTRDQGAPPRAGSAGRGTAGPRPGPSTRPVRRNRRRRR